MGFDTPEIDIINWPYILRPVQNDESEMIKSGNSQGRTICDSV